MEKLMRLIISAEYQPADNEQGRVVRYKFAFQWCESQVRSTFDVWYILRTFEQGEPWWLVSDRPIDQFLQENRLLGAPEEDMDMDFQIDQRSFLFFVISNQLALTLQTALSNSSILRISRQLAEHVIGPRLAFILLHGPAWIQSATGFGEMRTALS